MPSPASGVDSLRHIALTLLCVQQEEVKTKKVNDKSIRTMRKVDRISGLRNRTIDVERGRNADQRVWTASDHSSASNSKHGGVNEPAA